ncbi:MAG: alpha/beta hydrolase fold domain-containing protein [Pseudomonadota bacterium]
MNEPAPDYDWIIDAQTREFIRQTQEIMGPDGSAGSVEARRAAYDAVCRHFNAGRPEGVETEDLEISGPHGEIPLRRYSPPARDGAALVLYFHGGGFVVGGLESHDDVCAELCARTGFEVVSVDYRMAPEFQFPAHFDDAFAAWDWAASQEATGAGRRLLVAGDSAGATLAAAVCHAARGRAHAPSGQVLIYPSLGGDPTRGSYALHADAPMLSRADRAFYHSQRDMSLIPERDPRAYPLRDDDFAGLPITLCVNAQCDPLADDGKAYRDRILAAGGQALSVEEPGLVHGFLRARRISDQAAEAFGRIAAGLSAMGRGARPEI